MSKTMQWNPVPTAVPYCDFVWIHRENGEIELAYHVAGRFQTAESAGDSEGLSAEYREDVTHWMELSVPVFA